MIDAYSIHPGTVSVLIGPNGSGKSRLLRELCSEFLRSGDDVIAIAPTVYDRFRKMPQRGLKFFGARQGRSQASRVVRAALERAYSENPQVLKNLTQALQYTDFDPVIGIALPDLNLANFPIAAEQLTNREAEELHGALAKWQRRAERDGVVRLRMNSFSFEELDALALGELAKHGDLLYRTKTTSRIEYFLYRNGKPIRLLDACSGEISFITTVAFISSQIEHRTVIAIDEPETSLHPAWQQSYVRTLLDLFHYYEPRILISTHSPIIISGAEVGNGAITVHEVEDGQTRVFGHELLSLEEMYDRLFGLITPKNHYLSQRAILLLNALNAGERSLDEVLKSFSDLRTKSYDESQHKVIIKFEEIARQLVTNIPGRQA